MIREFLLTINFILSVFCELLDEYEGSNCTWKGAIGKCVNIYKCESAQMFLETKEYPPICQFDGKVPIVCCTDCTFVEDFRKIVYKPKIGVLTVIGKTANDECVNFIHKLDYDCKLRHQTTFNRTFDPDRKCYDTFSINLAQVVPEDVHLRNSHLALLGYGNNTEIAEWLCAGAIVSEKFILTAAHCMMQKKLGPVKYVAVGIQKRTDSPEMWQKYLVRGIHVYANYQPPSKYHDIALIETVKLITFSKEVLPACLNSEDDIPASKADIVVWDTEGENEGTLKQIPLRQFDEEKCSELFSGNVYLSKGFKAKTQVCYGDLEKPEDSCQSDSGSPLTAISHSYHCAQLVLGVTSVDRNCESTGSSAMFTKVSYYIPWIESVIWPTKDGENFNGSTESKK